MTNFAAIYDALSDEQLGRILRLADQVQERKDYEAALRQREMQRLRERRRIEDGFRQQQRQRRAS